MRYFLKGEVKCFEKIPSFVYKLSYIHLNVIRKVKKRNAFRVILHRFYDAAFII